MAVGKVQNPTSKTVRLIATDASQKFADNLLSNDSSRVVAALITVEGNDLRFAFNTAALNSPGSETGHVIPNGGSVRVTDTRNVTGFNFANSVIGSTAVIQATFEFES